MAESRRAGARHPLADGGGSGRLRQDAPDDEFLVASGGDLQPPDYYRSLSEANPKKPVIF